MAKTASFYIVIPVAFALAMTGRQSNLNSGSYFGYAYTTDSTCVTSINSANDFPDAFDSLAATMPDSALQIIGLTIDDFPASPPIKN